MFSAIHNTKIILRNSFWLYLMLLSILLAHVTFPENIVLSETTLTHFMPLVSFYTPWEHLKTFNFLMFSGGIKREQWQDMGLQCPQ